MGGVTPATDESTVAFGIFKIGLSSEFASVVTGHSAGAVFSRGASLAVTNE